MLLPILLGVKSRWYLLHRAVCKKDLATAAVLIKLGADPLLVNGRQHTSAQQLSLKFWQNHGTKKVAIQNLILNNSILNSLFISHLCQMPLPTVNGNMLEVLLSTCTHWRCLFPRDDLNLGLDIMAAADQFLLVELKQLCQQLLAEKIDA